MKRKILPLFIFVLSMTTLFAQVNITFEVNTADITVDAGGLYIAGGTGFGFPGDNELTDPDNDGIYTITLQRDMNFSSHYTFLNGNCPDWGCKEQIGGLPCSDPTNFNDRFLPEVTGDITIKACFGNCASDGTCVENIEMIDLTFELNTANIDVDPGGIFLAGGGAFGVAGDNPMTDPDNDGIYTITVAKPMGIASHYTFLNGNCPDWSCKEDIAGLPCSDPSAFNDRFLPTTMTDTTIKACFGNCASDGSCEENTEMVDITFELNTANIMVDPGGIFLAGGASFGIPGDNPMIDPEGDGIYTITVTKPEGFSGFYTFTNGNCPDFSCKEDLAELSCGDPTNFNDRFLPATMSDATIQACFGNCVDNGTCETTSISGLTTDKNLFTLRPTLVHDYINLTFGDDVVIQKKQVVVMNSVGQVFESVNVQNEMTYTMNTTRYSSGIYFVTVTTDKTILTKKFVVQK